MAGSVAVAEEMFGSKRAYERCVRNQRRKRGGKKLRRDQGEPNSAADQ